MVCNGAGLRRTCRTGPMGQWIQLGPLLWREVEPIGPSRQGL